MSILFALSDEIWVAIVGIGHCSGDRKELYLRRLVFPDSLGPTTKIFISDFFIF